jgi:hypothetical protein
MAWKSSLSNGTLKAEKISSKLNQTEADFENELRVVQPLFNERNI